MRGFLFFSAAAISGGLAYWGFDTWSSRKAEHVSAAASSDAEDFGRSADGGDLLTESDAVPESAVSAGETAPPAAALRPAAGAPVLSPRPVFVESPAVPEASVPDASAPSLPAKDPALAEASAFEEERSLARALYETGDRERGIRKLAEIFALSKDRRGIDLGPEASRLLEGDSSFERRREYAQYLLAVDRSGRYFDEQRARTAKSIQTSEKDAESAYRAWDDLTLAYDMARDRPQKRKVLDSLEPFIARMVFSGRYTPILKSHMIQAGESLSAIAKRFNTTTDALCRLNGLKSDRIQPRQRLRILEGKAKVFVDKTNFLLWVRIDGRIFLEYPVGLGRDNATPVGNFVIKVRQKDPTWWRPGEAPIPPGDARNILGSRWLGFQETQNFAGFGIHGTADPASLGKESSAGCIRVRNEDLEVLFDFLSYGTEVVVQG